MSPADIPINSLAWLAGSIACFALGIKSYIIFKKSYSQIARYISWFGIIMGFSLIFYSVPALFTQNSEYLRYSWVTGEFFTYISLIPQAAILWSLMMRSRISVYFLTMPVAIIGLSAWIYSAPRLSITVQQNFVSYSEPGISSFTMALLLGGLFIPVGFHFVRATLRQAATKERLSSFVLGMVYIGTGISTSTHLLLTGQVATVMSSIGNIAFFALLFGVIAWPRKMPSRSVLPDAKQAAYKY